MGFVMLKAHALAAKTPFRTRLASGLRFESEVEARFSELRYKLHRCGGETYPRRVKDQLIKLDDFTSLFLRFQPDFYCVTAHSSFFIECKGRRQDSRFYAFNVDELELQMQLTRLGIRILVVFESGSGFKAQWLDKLRIFKTCDGSPSGSGGRFALISERDLPNLDSILFRRVPNG